MPGRAIRAWLLQFIRLASLATLASLLQSAQAAPSDLPTRDPIIERAALRDPGGALKVEDLSTQTFLPYAGTLKLGNADIPTWLRLTVRPPSSGDWVLLIQPQIIQDARVYVPSPGGGWQLQQLGSRFAFSQRRNTDLNSVAPLTLAGPDLVTIYVRVHTPTALVSTRVVQASDAQELDVRTHAVIGAYTGIGVSMLLVSLVGWLCLRERLWLYSAAMDLTSVMLQLAQLGFAAKYLLPDSTDVIHQAILALSVISVASIALYSWRLLALFDAKRWATSPYVAAVCLCPLLIALAAAGRSGPALAVNNLVVLVLALWGVFVIWFVRPQDRWLCWMWRSFAIVLSLYALFWVTPFVLHVQSTQLSLYPALPSTLLTQVMTAAIAARYTLLRSRSLQAAEQDRREATLRLEQEESRHRETSGFLSMLVHEIRNPLARIQAMVRRTHAGAAPLDERQVEALASIDSSARDIAGLLQRSVETDQLERGALLAQPRAEDAAMRLSQWLAQHRDRERIDVTLPSELVCTLDISLWLSMVRNLVDNALKYGSPGDRVTLRLHDEGDLLCVDVGNAVGPTGRPDPTRLFRKYYRSELAEGISGTGLGLYWVAQLSRSLGGSLHYLDQASGHDGDQVTFRLCMPF